MYFLVQANELTTPHLAFLRAARTPYTAEFAQIVATNAIAKTEYSRWQQIAAVFAIGGLGHFMKTYREQYCHTEINKSIFTDMRFSGMPSKSHYASKFKIRQHIMYALSQVFKRMEWTCCGVVLTL